MVVVMVVVRGYQSLAILMPRTRKMMTMMMKDQVSALT
jgi:hypothetical protein